MAVRAKWWEAVPLVGGVVACAACCTLPLLAAAGVGSGALLRLAEVAEPLGMILLILGAAVAALGFLRGRLGGPPSGRNAGCAVDGSCGCAPASAHTKG
jgi:hypothetical protein